MDAHQQIERSVPIPEAGWRVYFLKKKGEIVYIGATFSLAYRITEHRKGGKDFDEVTCIECASKADAYAQENALIKRFRPALNRRRGVNPRKAVTQGISFHPSLLAAAKLMAALRRRTFSSYIQSLVDRDLHRTPS